MTDGNGDRLFFGDLHNHCNISYGRGSLREALSNARESLDFCSITGHAFWPDMPDPNERTQPIIDFHKRGFAKLKEGWHLALREMEQWDSDGNFIVFPGYEMHSLLDGDYTIIYRDFINGITYAQNLTHLKQELARLKTEGIEAIAFPHHIAYRKGARGINWDTFTSDFSPVVEIVSMHGCSESDDAPRPFLSTMGPSDWKGTMQYGLQQGHQFGVIGNTDHHSAHPGSYGGGLTGVWAESLTRTGLWNAIQNRRTCALTGDRIHLQFTVNDEPMGSVIPYQSSRRLRVSIEGEAALDYVDILKNNTVIRRFSQLDFKSNRETASSGIIRTFLYFELGWGHKTLEQVWDAEIHISDGEIIRSEPRFRGVDHLSPVHNDYTDNYYRSKCYPMHSRAVRFETVTIGNHNFTTNNSQGLLLFVEMSLEGTVQLKLNGTQTTIPLLRLREGSIAGNVPNEIEAPAWRLHYAPTPDEYCWNIDMNDHVVNQADRSSQSDVYYVRVRQVNDQWAWSSPVFLTRDI